jgi:hypothetical protein
MTAVDPERSFLEVLGAGIERGRRKRSLNREWRISALGNQFQSTNGGFNVVVYQGFDLGARVEHRASGYQRVEVVVFCTEQAWRSRNLKPPLGHIYCPSEAGVVNGAVSCRHTVPLGGNVPPMK